MGLTKLRRIMKSAALSGGALSGCSAHHVAMAWSEVFSTITQASSTARWIVAHASQRAPRGCHACIILLPGIYSLYAKYLAAMSSGSEVLEALVFLDLESP